MMLAIGASWFLLIALDPDSPPLTIIVPYHASILQAGTHLDTASFAVATTQTRFLMRAPGADRIVVH